MQVRAGVGWQYALTDLSLILFMVCAAALAHRPPQQKPFPVQAVIPVPQPSAEALADPVAVWRAGPGAPSLDAWLAAQPLDPRQRLTIVAHYAGNAPKAAFLRAEALLAEVRRLPQATRIVVEPADVETVSATLTWDAAGAVAQPLQ